MLRQRVDVEFPGELRARAELAAVQQDERVAPARFEIMRALALDHGIATHP